MRISRPILDTLRAAQARHADGDLAGALDLCEQVLSRAPAHPTANLMAGLLLVEAERYALALPHLRIAVAHHFEDVELREALAGTLVQLGEPAQAMVHLRAVVSAQPENANARFNLGRALIDVHNFEEAERVCSSFALAYPGDPEGFNHLGLARLGLGDAIGAEQCFRTAIQLHDKEPAFHTNLAVAQAEQVEHTQNIGAQK